LTSVEELLIDSNDALRGLIARLEASGATRCGLDTEADSLHSYREKLCLFQLNCAGILAVIDPLKIEMDALQDFMTFLEAREVWLHGADFDMTLMQRTFDRVPTRILDTQMAARLSGAERFGLANLVEANFGVQLSKSSQKADWGARPLKEKLLRYAFDDVRYLLELADKLSARVRELNRWHWFEEWCRSSRNSVLSRKERSADEVWRIAGWGKLDRRALAFLRELWHWRDQESQARDCPPFKIMNNQPLVDFAEEAAAGKNPRGARGLNGEQARRFREALARAAALPPEEWPKRRLRRDAPKEEVDAAAYEELRKRRDAKAAALGLDPTILATRAALETLALDPSQSEQYLMDWQQALLFGED